MRRFARLYQAIDATTSTNAKVEAMAAYFREAPRADAAWALHILSGGKIKRLVTGREVAGWAMTMAGVPAWLFDECYSIVGDLAETVTLLAASPPDAEHDDTPLHTWIEERLLPMRELHSEMRSHLVMEWMRRLDPGEVFVLVKLVTGSLRVGVSRTLVTRAVAQAAGLDAALITDRLMGDWRPTPQFMERLFSPGTVEIAASRPYPFYLASQLNDPVESLGPRADWLAEWKWDGIRAQLVRRAGQVHLWSRGEELVTERFPEIVQAAARLPSGVVIDGELTAFRDGSPLPFALLQRRIGRQKLGAKVLQDAPVSFLAYDLLEHEGIDIRPLPLAERRSRLQSVIGPAHERIRIPAPVDAASWDELARQRASSRERNVEGIMLKRLDSPYGSGRERGGNGWWKWKIEPYSVDAVLVYAQPGHGRRANLLTDYTFALRDTDAGGELVPVAKAYSGLSDEEIRRLDAWIRDNTVERFGPVRAVTAHHVFEIAFEGIASSPRHRSGVAVRFPRIARWRTDKTPADADSLAHLKGMMRAP